MKDIFIDNEKLKVLRDNADWKSVFLALGLQKDDRKSREEDWWAHSPFASGGDSTPSFHINSKGWYCHSTGRGGGVIELVQALQGGNCYDAGRWLLENGCSFLNDDVGTTRRQVEKTVAQDPVPDASDLERGKDSQEVKEKRKGNERNEVIRQNLIPLLEMNHPEFERRGIDRATLDVFGVGFLPIGKSRSSLSDRLVFQIRNENGEIIGHTGRAITKDQIDQDGKWKFYAGFRKQQEVFGGDVFCEKLSDVKTVLRKMIVCEGCFDVLKLHTAGIPAVATFGSHLSGEQVERLRELTDRTETNEIFLWFDRDTAGESGQQAAKELLRESGFEVSGFDWNRTFESPERGQVGIPDSVTDPAEFSVEQLQFLRKKGVV